MDKFAFRGQGVIRYGASEFAVNSRCGVCLLTDRCTAILFYSDATADLVGPVWEKAAEKVNGPIMAHCNLSYEDQVRQAFSEVQSDKTNPFNWIDGEPPFVLIYRNGWPVAHYNGDPTVEAIVKFCNTLACKADYVERYFGDNPCAAQAVVKQSTDFINYPGND